MTITEKILAQAAGRAYVEPGEIINARIHSVMVTDLKGPNTFKVMEEEVGVTAVHEGVEIIFVLDHLGPANNLKTAEQFKSCRVIARKYGLKNFYDLGHQGIGHQIMCEDGFVLPGTVTVGIDSHSTTYGALGSVAFGISNSEAAVILATGELWLRVPETTRFNISGVLPYRTYAKDVILHLIGMTQWNGEVLYKAVEFAGSTIESMSIADRMVLCNMTAEMGAKNGIVAPDSRTIQFMNRWPEKKFEMMTSDPNAAFSYTFDVDVSSLSPQVACPHRIDNVKPVDAVVGVKIDQAFLGSCTNGRLEDLLIAAEILKGRKVHSDVRLLVVPASQSIYLEALKRGIIETLVESGAAVLTSNCAACAGIGSGNIASGEVCISSTNRNFRGRMGAKDAEIYLASPATVAASAIEGVIADPRKY
ncbi:MAG TPA: 3-isopropylmalate dehydratase large subunit [Syntrophorhabdus aromaticivorans]|nr:3-isopropylmalate dehydratase large subunit [Syntrophorhabdus aromaticivorans]